MLPSTHQPNLSPEDHIKKLLEEITSIEQSLNDIKKELSDFQNTIHKRLENEIKKLDELNQLYKNYKKEKKSKRLLQKQKGKNYIPPTGIKQVNTTPLPPTNLEAAEQKELRKLYKQAIVHVHPDKLLHAATAEHIHRATDLTARLNEIYQSGDLEELLNFYQYVILDNAKEDQIIHIPEVNEKIRLSHLTKKKKMIEKELAELKSTYTYGILSTYENPLSFIDELYTQFHERIKLMEKRTKKIFKQPF
ncbi:J domain-containing protein [Anditalea andensis]|uniref:J domain-containing protein n=1 Tax=Anditalea andensis TaxID=1048983 RepID=A0A074LPA9_9BACT|nr:hypothetical protein [Anditalea andensis]KEO75752.1 hypothetical protein EL17_22260 [Anditalea andensis]